MGSSIFLFILEPSLIFSAMLPAFSDAFVRNYCRKFNLVLTRMEDLFPCLSEVIWFYQLHFYPIKFADIVVVWVIHALPLFSSILCLSLMRKFKTWMLHRRICLSSSESLSLQQTIQGILSFQAVDKTFFHACLWEKKLSHVMLDSCGMGLNQSLSNAT